MRAGGIARLALIALGRERLQLASNLAMIVGVVLPLLTVLGAKNGAVADLLDGLARDPALLVIETADNAAVSDAQIAEVAALPGVIFVVPKPRSQSNWVLVRGVGSGADGGIHNARVLPTLPGDPLLAGHGEPGPGDVAISAALAQRMALGTGDRIALVTQAEGRSRQGRAERRIVAVLPEERLPGHAVLGADGLAEAVEAFSDGYAVPLLGADEGRDPAQRRPGHEGVRVNVASMQDVGPVAEQIPRMLGRDTVSAAAQIARTSATIDDLDAAFGMIALVAFMGVAAGVVGAQVNDVLRRRRVLATLAMMGLDRHRMVLLPLVQAAATISAGLVLSLGLFVPAAALAGAVLDPAGTAPGGFVHLTPGDLAAVIGGGALVAVLASIAAGRRLLSIDPAIILREVA